ncbi:MAG: glutathione S-transferase [Myxococcales bacterium]|nr:glutathione S-transferase [Myxococcales bacterium]
MIQVHHLNESRSQRILWLLEELATPYEVVAYQRENTRLAPDALKAVHPLGKSPVLEDGVVKIAESGAIVDYLISTYGKGRFSPAIGTPAWITYNEWMHYAEGSAMLPLLLNMYVGRLGEKGEALHPRIESEIQNHLGYVESALGGQAFLMGDSLTGADIQMSFVCEVARAMRKLPAFPKLSAYLDRLHARDAWKRALERGGTYHLGA